MIKKSLDFIRKSGEKIGIIYGHDCDSIASAAIIFKLMKKLNKKPKLIVSTLNYSVTEKEIEKVKKSKLDSCFILDIGNVPRKAIEELNKSVPIAIIDHHIPKRFKVSCYINPRLENPRAYIPVSYLVWKMYSKFFDPRDTDWIAAIGVLGDHGVEENKDLFLFLKKNKKELIKGKLTTEYLFKNTLLGKITKMINSSSIVKKRVGVLYSTKKLIKSKSYLDVLNDEKLKSWNQIVEKELKKIENDFEKHKIIWGKILFYIVKSKYPIKSTFAGSLPRKFKNKIILIGQKIGRRYEFSVRRGENCNVDLSLFVKNLSRMVKNLEGGGHPSASGFRVPEKEIDELIEKLKKRGKDLL